MKHTDDYAAKFKIWVENPTVYPVPRIINLPHFGCKRFSSYAEMNGWKKELLAELERRGGAQWGPS